MKLWTLCKDRKRWMNRWTLSESDTMGNSFDRIKEYEDGALTRKEYPDDFLDQFAGLFDNYVIHVDEHETYDNDDYNIYTSDDREYTMDITLGRTTVISDGRPVGEMMVSKEYAGGMCNRSTTYGTILFYEKPNREAGETFKEGCTEWHSSGRTSYRRTYTIVERKAEK